MGNRGGLGNPGAQRSPLSGRVVAGLALVLAVAVGRCTAASDWLSRDHQVGGRSSTVFADMSTLDGRMWPVLSRGGPMFSPPGTPARPVSATTIHRSEPPVYIDPRSALPYDALWCFRVLPDGLIYRSYLAGAKESRFASAFVHERDLGWIWDIALGGRVGILRYGTESVNRPEGWQIDVEGAGLPRLDLENDRDLVAADFRFGIPLTYGRGRYQTKFAYYHLSSHLGDEFLVRNPGVSRINFVRDVLVWGHSFYWTDDVRLYAEAGWAFCTDGGSEPWEFQFGIDYSPARPSELRGDPFLAVNVHLREEVDFGGNLVVQTGWQWRGNSGHLFRVGMQYFTGKSDQFQFFNLYEEKLGLGIWYDY